MNKQLYEKENNINKPFFPVVRLEDIIDTISEKSIQWILNNYNHIYVEWKNDVVGTRLSVPTILRRNGLWITYNNGDRLITEYYIGKNTEIKDKHWQDDTNWEDYTNKLIDGTVEYRHLSESLKQLFNKGNITNFPDEEDITSNGIALSFKDREYQPENFSGLGRVILRKNIIKIGEEYKNILTQSMINKENTIYEIRYDFDLNGGEIIIPEGCVLDFQGGYLSNGIINGNNSGIKADIIKIFNADIDIQGTWCLHNAYCEWFGANENKIDVSEEINKTLFYFNICNLNNKTYQLKNPIYINKKIGQRLIGNGINSTLIKAHSQFNIKSYGTYLDGRIDFENSLIIVRQGDKNKNYNITIDPLDNIEISNLTIDGNNIVNTGVEIWSMFSNYHDILIKNTIDVALLFRRGWNNSFNNIYCYYNKGDGAIFESECNSILLNKLCVAHAEKSGVIIKSGHSITINNCSIEECKYNGLEITNYIFSDLENYGASRTHISGLNILSIYLEHNCISNNYSNLYFNGTISIDQCFINGVYINDGNGRPINITGTIRHGFKLSRIVLINVVNKSYIGYLNTQRHGDESKIVLELSESLVEFYNAYESTQVAFITNAGSGSRSFNGINLRKNVGYLRSKGDLEFDTIENHFKYYRTDGDINNSLFLTFYTRYTYYHTDSGLTFDYFYSNGFIILRVYGNNVKEFKGDISISAPFRIANEFGTEALIYNDDIKISTRDYDVIYVETKNNITVNVKLIYPVIQNY